MKVRNKRSVVIPTIETERLLLRPPETRDIAGYTAIVTTERGRYIGGPFDPETAALDFLQMVSGWVLRGYGALTVRPRDQDTYLGTVLVHHEHGDPEPELGWLFTSDAEGRGFAYEAGHALKHWAFSEAQFQTLVSYVYPDNQRGVALARRLGGVPEPGPHGVVAYRYEK